MENNDDSQLANIVRILSLLLILASMFAANENVRYQMLKLEAHAVYWAHRGLTRLQRLRDPQWRSKLLDRRENEVMWPQTKPPTWWLHVNNVELGDGADASISLPPAE